MDFKFASIPTIEPSASAEMKNVVELLRKLTIDNLRVHAGFLLALAVFLVVLSGTFIWKFKNDNLANEALRKENVELNIELVKMNLTMNGMNNEMEGMEAKLAENLANLDEMKKEMDKLKWELTNKDMKLQNAIIIKFLIFFPPIIALIGGIITGLTESAEKGLAAFIIVFITVSFAVCFVLSLFCFLDWIAGNHLI